MTRRPKARVDPAALAFEAARAQIRLHPLFAPLSSYGSRNSQHPWADISLDGSMLAHPTRKASEAEWVWVFAHCLLHLGFGTASCDDVLDFQPAIRLGSRPPSWEPGRCVRGGPAKDPKRWADRFAAGLSNAAVAAIDVAGGARSSLSDARPLKTEWDLALGWFVSNYPLLGALASTMKVVADAELARGWDISIAAVSTASAEIYVNPLAGLSRQEWRFVLAHEMLHAALRHCDRVGGRDAYLWNIAADFVVNGWLVEMGVGEAPEGVLHDPSLRGLSAESVYDRITADLRRYRKLLTLRGHHKGDLLGEPLRGPADLADLDEFYRRALLTGLSYHTSARGLLPAGLVEEIRALEHPPLSWDAQLARWFEEFVPSVEKRRTYARASRRQASTPDIPRPGWVRPESLEARPTFGVVLDTSGSMDVRLLGKALGAIASYAAARDVPAARVVFCDAMAYDAGYVPVEDIAGRVTVRGRGGTVLQPGIDLLDRADDFPAAGPILVITDGGCDVVRIRREHAFLIPAGAHLPFRARGPVFRMS
ncbi:vWA domain-containing protein [Lentzea sp. NPDC054927]